MQKWMLKAVVQKALSLLPAKHRLNYLFQRYVTKGVRLSEAYFQDRLIHLQQHLEAYGKYKGIPEGATALELGTGWYPVIPVGLFLAGADRIVTVDISPLMDREKVLTTLRQYQQARQRRLPGLPADEGRWAVLDQVLDDPGSYTREALLRTLRLQYLVADARALPLPDHSVDLITSNNTFEHIYPEVLPAILREFGRVAKADAVMSHFVDMSDHFAHLDPAISIYHFLRFSERAWSWIDNDIQPQNRWRITHYRELYQRLGIPLTEELNRPGDLAALRRVPLDPAFAALPERDLAVSHSYLLTHFGEEANQREGGTAPREKGTASPGTDGRSGGGY